MKKPKVIRGFDALKMKESVQNKVYSQIRGLGDKEMLEYFDRKAKEGPFADIYLHAPRAGRRTSSAARVGEKRGRYRPGKP